MNYTDLVAKILKTSGRYDLINEDGTDAGMLEYVNRAQRLLDRKANMIQLTARRYDNVIAGDYCKRLPDCIVIQSVWLLPLLEGVDRKPLIREGWETMQTRYGLVVERRDTGEPRSYALGSFRGMPDPRVQLVKNLNIFTGFMDVVGDNDWDVNGFFFHPVADRTYSLQVVGKFYTPKFGETKIDGAVVRIDNTYWSEHHPELLEIAVRYWMEVDNRNTEGKNDWLSVMADMLMDLDFENVENSINDELVMGEELL